jgi:hypothetical protein
MSNTFNKNKYRDGASQDVLAATFKPREAAAIRKFVRDYLKLKDLSPPPNEFKIVKTPPLHYSKEDVIKDMRTGMATGNLAGFNKSVEKLLSFQESSMPLLQTMLVTWYASIMDRDLDIDDVPPILKHLKEEVDELINTPTDLEEYADILILTLQALYLSGYSVDDWLKASWKKHYVNIQRKWLPPDEEGIVRHVKDE